MPSGDIFGCDVEVAAETMNHGEAAGTAARCRGVSDVAGISRVHAELEGDSMGI